MSRLLIVLLLFINLNLFSKNNFIISNDTSSNKLNKKKLYKFLAIEGAVLAGTISYLRFQWYSDKQRVPFHFYNDSKGWLQIDKFGHFYASYLESLVGYKILKKSNFKENKALLFGGSQGFILEAPIEFFDAYYDGWGFSVSDIIANALGSTFFIVQQKIFNEQWIKPKLTFSRSIYARNANGYLGKNNFISELIYDYNGYTYWFSFTPNKFIKSEFLPDWLALSIGYGGDGMLGEFENVTKYKGVMIPEYKRYRQFYLSLDVDFSKINTNSKFLKKVFNSISYIKFPFPTLEISNNKIKGYWIHY